MSAVQQDSTLPDADVGLNVPAPAMAEETQPATTPDAPISDPDPQIVPPDIEQIFQKVEQESERRAHEEQLEEQRSRPGTANTNASQPSPPPSTAPASTLTQTTAVVGRDPARDRRRGSISVSRFGQATDLSAGTLDNPSKLPSRKNSLIINAGSTGAFYQAQKYSGSADSFASDTEDTQRHVEDVHDEEQVTQMETIAGRVSLGKAMGRTIARRLSRAKTRSRDILAVPNGLVIGVSVEEATTEAEQHEGEEANANGDAPKTPQAVSFAYAQAEGTRSRRSTISMPNPPPSAPPTVTTIQEKRISSVNWMARAMELTKKFKRKSMAALPQSSSP